MKDLIFAATAAVYLAIGPSAARCDPTLLLKCLRASAHLVWLGIQNASKDERYICARRINSMFAVGKEEHSFIGTTREQVCGSDGDKHLVLPHQTIWWLGELGSESLDFGALTLQASFPIIILDATGAQMNSVFLGGTVSVPAAASLAKASKPSWRVVSQYENPKQYGWG